MTNADKRSQTTATPERADDQLPPPPDPRMLRIMKAVVIILGVMIVLMLGALIAGLIIKGTGGLRQGAPLPAELTLPADAAIESMAASGSQLAIAIRHPDGLREILVMDVARGRLLRRIRLIPRKTDTPARP
jgi:hypothetical protein